MNLRHVNLIRVYITLHFTLHIARLVKSLAACGLEMGALKIVSFVFEELKKAHR